MSAHLADGGFRLHGTCVNPDELVARAARWPRISLGRFPTPLEPLPQLTHRLGGPTLWVKRDDVAGPGGAGSKTRALEFLLGEAQARRASVVATFGGLQSSFACQMCAAASRLGAEAHCFYFEPRPAQLEGALLLAQQVGGRLHFLSLPRREASMTVEQACRLVRWGVRLWPGCMGRPLFFMPVGGHGPVGCLAYVQAAIELDAQLRERGIGKATVLVATGTGGTLAGLLAGLHLLGSRHRPLGVDVGRLWRRLPASTATLAAALCQRLGSRWAVTAADVPLIERVYVGEGYAHPSREGEHALRLAAESEGLVLDTVYTAKAMAALIDLVRRGRWSRNDHLVFLHSGGASAAPPSSSPGQ